MLRLHSLVLRKSNVEECLLDGLVCIAEASTTEEPDAGKLHVRVCTGGAG